MYQITNFSMSSKKISHIIEVPVKVSAEREVCEKARRVELRCDDGKWSSLFDAPSIGLHERSRLTGILNRENKERGGGHRPRPPPLQLLQQSPGGDHFRLAVLRMAVFFLFTVFFVAIGSTPLTPG